MGKFYLFSKILTDFQKGLSIERPPTSLCAYKLPRVSFYLTPLFTRPKQLVFFFRFFLEHTSLKSEFLVSMHKTVSKNYLQERLRGNFFTHKVVALGIVKH